jgi:predicted PolB exonuclease-like 3'-5' exonuclease
MFTPAQVENILFIDLETVSITPKFEELSPRMQALWEKKSIRYQRNDIEKGPADLYVDKAAIHAEFGKIICISCGLVKFDRKGKPSIKLRSYAGDDEKKLLAEFGDMVKWANSEGRTLCAHNGKEFDFPYLCRRFVINSLPIPNVLSIQGKKPWEVNLLDTMDLWKFGDYKAFTSLDLLTSILEIPSPKDDIDGSQVGRVYWEEKDLERIVKYCEKDVEATAQVLLRMSRLPLLGENI